MTDEELKAIEERAGAATPGPWVQHYYDGYPRVTIGVHYKHIPTRADAAFIAAARSDVPALCAEVHKMRAEVNRLKYEWRQAEHEAYNFRLKNGWDEVYDLRERLKTAIWRAEAAEARVDKLRASMRLGTDGPETP